MISPSLGIRVNTMARTTTQKTIVARAKLTDTQKSSRRDKHERLNKALTGAQKNYQETARGIAKEFGRCVAMLLEGSRSTYCIDRTVTWTKSQLYMGGKFTRQRRKTSAWNGYIHAKLAQTNAGM